MYHSRVVTDSDTTRVQNPVRSSEYSRICCGINFVGWTSTVRLFYMVRRSRCGRMTFLPPPCSVSCGNQRGLNPGSLGVNPAAPEPPPSHGCSLHYDCLYAKEIVFSSACCLLNCYSKSYSTDVTKYGAVTAAETVKISAEIWTASSQDWGCGYDTVRHWVLHGQAAI